jgi:hypothetical protein
MIQLLYPFKKQYQVTQTWQEHKDRAIKNGWCWKPGSNCTQWYYPGIDFGSPIDVELLASIDARVTLRKENTGYGWSTDLDDGQGNRIIYGHLSKFLVEQGQIVKKGHIIGLSGGAKGTVGAGTSTGPHLHWEYRKDGIPTDPTPFIEALQPLDDVHVGNVMKFISTPRIRTAPVLCPDNIMGIILPVTNMVEVREIRTIGSIIWGRFDNLWIALKEGNVKYYDKS